jgi:hypothetical protein
MDLFRPAEGRMSTGTATETILGTTGGRGNERKLGRCSKDTGNKRMGPEDAERQREVRSDDLPAVGRVARGKKEPERTKN